MIWYILVVALVFGQTLFPPEGQMIFGDDIHRQYYFFRQFFNDWIGKGVFPWWNPYLFSGEPFIANPVVNIWYPMNWVFLVLPLNVAYSWHLAFHLCWAMCGMQKLTKSWIAGLIFGLSGFFMARTFAGHVDVIAAASFMPWTIWAMQKKSVPFAAVIFAFQLLAGYQTMAFFTVIAIGITTLVYAFVFRSIQLMIRVALAGLGGIGLAAFQLLPVQEFFRSSIRTYHVPYSWHSYGAIEWRNLLQFFNPFLFGNQYTYNGPPPNFIEHSMYVGIGGLVLAIMGIAFLGSTLLTSLRLRKEKDKTMLTLQGSFFLVVVFGLWVSLGPHAPVDLQYILWKLVPMYSYLRIPARHLILVVFGLSALAGIGFTSLRVPKVLKGLMISGIIIEMVWFGRGFIELKPIPESRHDEELITLLKQDKEPYRIIQNFGVWLPERDVMDFDSVMSYGIFSATGYDPSILRPYFEYVSVGRGAHMMLSHDVQIPYITDSEILDRLNVKYVIVPTTHDPFQNNARYKRIYDKESRVYENATVKPRFYFQEPCGTAQMTSYSPNTIELTTESFCDTHLMSSEIWYPGWEAYIDGKKIDIIKSEGIFRTLFVPTGKHLIVYHYQPRIFVYGVWVSIFTAIILFRMVLMKRKPIRL